MKNSYTGLRIQMSNKFQLKNGKCFADYIDAAGLGLGFCVGNAAMQLFKAGMTSDSDEHDKLMTGCAWYINHAVESTHLNREEIVEMVSKITEAVERDQIAESQRKEDEKCGLL